MSDSSNDDGWLQRLRDGARATLDRAMGAANRRLDDLEQQLESLAPRLLEAENVDQLQRSLSTVARTLYGLGFRIDDQAKLLFELFDWVERRHGRRPIVEAIGNHNPMLDDAFLNVVHQFGGVASPDDRRRKNAERAIETYREHGRREVLRLIAQLASLECDRSPPDAPDDLADYIRESPLPDRFTPLVDLASEEPRRRAGTAPEESDASTVADSTWRDDVRRGIDALVARDASVQALVQSAAPAFDRQMRFLTGSVLFATQAFVTRTAIEALPEMAEQSGISSDDDDDVIDV